MKHSISRQYSNQDISAQQLESPDFHGAAIIDEQGLEIPITEFMIQDTLAKITDLLPLQSLKRYLQQA